MTNRLLRWILGPLMLFAAGDTGGLAGGSPSTGSAGSGASPAPGGAPSVSPAQGQQGGSSAPPNGGSTQAPVSSQGAGSENDQNLATLRANYERYKQLGEVDQLATTHKAWTQYTTTALQLGEALGYTPESVQAAISDDPVGIMDQLVTEFRQQRSQQQQRGQQPDTAAIDQRVEELTRPLMQHVVKQRADSANQAFDSEFGTLFDGHPMFKGKSDIPPEIRSVVYDMVSESLKYNDKALKTLYEGGKTPEIQKTFDGVMERFQQVVGKYVAWQSKVSGGQQQVEGQQQPAKLSLDDIIEGRRNAEQAMATMRG